MSNTPETNEKHDRRHGRRFFLNGSRHQVPDNPISLSELRSMTDPAIPSGHEIWRDVDGGQDERLDESCVLEICVRDVFYSSGPDGARPRDITIVINDVEVIAPAVSLTGTQLRELGAVPVGHRLFRDVDGSRDERIGDNETVTLRHGAEFYSKQHKPFHIVVNGREKTDDDLEDRDLTFDEVIALAFENPPTGANVCFSVTYRKGASNRPEGILVAGESVKAKKGMVFNVTNTTKS